MGKISWKGVKEIVKDWRMGDYIRQTSIVVIGVLVTFTGSGLVTNCSERKDIKSTMLLIRDELKSNRQKYEYIVSEFSEDEQLSDLLMRHDMNIHTIPEDSLKLFATTLGHIRGFAYTRNALNILQNSMLMQKIPDKEFLLSLVEVYEKLEGFKLSINGYYDMKEEVTTPFHLSLTDEQTALLYDGGYASWDIYLSDRALRNFLRVPARYFTVGYKERVLKEVDKMIRAIEEKYGFE